MSWLLVELIGLFATATNIWANILLAHKSEHGWTVRLLANAAWLAFGLVSGSLANTLNSLIFAGINIYALRKWRRERLEPKSTAEEQAEMWGAVARERHARVVELERILFEDDLLEPYPRVSPTK